MPKTPSPKNKTIKAWAIVSRGGILIGGGTKFYGYTALCVYSTRIAAKEHLSKTRNDVVVPCEITYSLPTPRVKKNK